MSALKNMLTCLRYDYKPQKVEKCIVWKAEKFRQVSTSVHSL